MKDQKTAFRYFTIMEYEKEQKWLEQQHREGWRLTDAKVCVYRFERCKPEEVVYQLDYNEDGRARREEYLQLFRDCGWEHVLDNVGYSYFRKPKSQMQGDEEIFCDMESRMDMFRRILRGRMIPLLVLFFCIFLPAIAMEILATAEGSPALNLTWLIPLGVVLALYGLVFAQLVVQYQNLKKKR